MPRTTEIAKKPLYLADEISVHKGLNARLRTKMRTDRYTRAGETRVRFPVGTRDLCIHIYIYVQRCVEKYPWGRISVRTTSTISNCAYCYYYSLFIFYHYHHFYIATVSATPKPWLRLQLPPLLVPLLLRLPMDSCANAISSTTTTVSPPTLLFL